MAIYKKEIRAIQAGTGMNLVFTFVFLFAVNFVALRIAWALFPEAIVFGNFALTPAWGLILTSKSLTLISVAAMPFVTYREWRRGRDYTPMEWMTTYFVLNVVSVWLLARFAQIIGFGISSWTVAVLLGTALDWAQGMAMMSYGKATGQQS